MPRVGFEITIPVFERAKTLHAFEGAATVIGVKLHLSRKKYMYTSKTAILKMRYFVTVVAQTCKHANSQFSQIWL
jgi:hypothetical protein